MAELYEHNRTAYEAASVMLKEKGRAAVIHPTGTGKSFIGFKLCEDHPDETVCWMSPSEYIFRTQLENWKAAGGEEPENIRFLTYAKLTQMDDQEMAGIRPDIVILDEFHRAGAQCWGAALKEFLAVCPDAPVLGLSATNIRYLDGQRDMAEELFGGNIASEMTLGDAVVRGILAPPEYVLSMYSCQKELERYRERARHAKNPAVRAEAEKYLEALRRALEKADGLDEVFYRHMAGQEAAGQTEEERSGQPGKPMDPARHGGDSRTRIQRNKVSGSHGRYLVFCANYEHMQEMIAKVPEWFGKVDPEPHVYRVYSEDRQAQEEFEKFKADTSGHLKLLFCIDMLNEGVHVDGVNGVVLLRPTVSPTVYKQQIGRALSAGKGGKPVVFDVVMNIENLYSIGTVEDEMQAAVRHYRERGESERIVNEHFRITDEVQDCVKLFRKLDGVLGAPWELMYRAAREYYDTYGNLEVTKRYVTEDGLSLGQWLDTQRKVHAGKARGVLTEEQAARLDAVGMRWEPKGGRSWERNFAAAQAYYEEHGDLLVPADCEYGGVRLGKWVARMRECRRKQMLSAGGPGHAAGKPDKGRMQAGTGTGAPCGTLTPEHIARLESVGMVWDVPDYRWERNYRAAEDYYRENGDLEVPYCYTSREGVRLGAWVSSMRAVRRETDRKRAGLTQEQVARLDRIGMVWGKRGSASRDTGAVKKEGHTLAV